MTYAPDHASALADVTEAGASVTFTLKTPGTITQSTGLFTGAGSSTVAGSAIRVMGDRKRYAELRLDQTETLSLFFTPTTFGELPALGSTVTWNSLTYTVRAIDDPIAPDGTAIAATVICARGDTR